MKTLNAIIYAIACIVLISSCKKDDETPSVSKAELLAGKTSKAWRKTAGKENGSDYYTTLPTCYKDDITVFSANKNFEFNEGATKCDSGDPQIIEADTWEFKSNETIINVFETDYKILELTNTTLRVSYTDDGDQYEDTYTAQ